MPRRSAHSICVASTNAVKLCTIQPQPRASANQLLVLRRALSNVGLNGTLGRGVPVLNEMITSRAVELTIQYRLYYEIIFTRSKPRLIPLRHLALNLTLNCFVMLLTTSYTFQYLSCTAGPLECALICFFPLPLPPSAKGQ
jgi:hypothetical protein